jgi:hypothetical protein
VVESGGQASSGFCTLLQISLQIHKFNDCIHSKIGLFADPRSIDLSLSMIYAGHVSGMGKARNTHRILVITPSRKGHLRNLAIDGWIILNKLI